MSESEESFPQPEKPVDLTPDQRAELAMSVGGEIFGEVIMRAHLIQNLRPIDLPNVFVGCIAHCMAFFKNDTGMPPEVMDRAALLAVKSLVMTLTANGRKLDGVIIPRIEQADLGLANSEGKEVGRA